ncbi:hypothetical protein [Sulfuriflexus mobilis]|uniref:hypothetical protein n=1 Tax=Sulfuriflexus mobilis TaxID=1811807 RepID=UPI000F83D91F|nr:hypothetical protein [Sulfuriflexus mobilis]
MDEEIIIGFSVSLIGGGIGAWLFLKLLRKWMRLTKEAEENSGSRAVPSWITGVIERFFFTLLVHFQLPGVPAAMLIWLTLKMVTNWNSPLRKEADKNHTRLAFSALLAGLISLGFAVYGGLISRGDIL